MLSVMLIGEAQQCAVEPSFLPRRSSWRRSVHGPPISSYGGEKARYDEEDQAGREIVAAFEQETGKEVEPKLGPQEELVADLMAAAAERLTAMAHPVYDDLPEGSPAVGIATVLTPAKLPDGPRPVITWVNGTAGALQKCMPSLVTAPLPGLFTGIPGFDEIIAQGWVVVAADSAVPGMDGPHAYMIGEGGEGRSGLDSVRAAKQMPELQLEVRTVVWGLPKVGSGAVERFLSEDLQSRGSEAEVIRTKL
jgi:hypothetical protein